jgi:hypothetical protein
MPNPYRRKGEAKSQRKFGKRRYHLANPAGPFNTKRRAKKSAKLHRKRGYNARIVPFKKGYNVYTLRKRK